MLQRLGFHVSECLWSGAFLLEAISSPPSKVQVRTGENLRTVGRTAITGFHIK